MVIFSEIERALVGFAGFVYDLEIKA